MDVREPDEFAAGHLPGARDSPRGFHEVAPTSSTTSATLVRGPRAPLLLYCGGGHRSALAAWTLVQMGFSRWSRWPEGWTAWTERGYPIQSRARRRRERERRKTTNDEIRPSPSG